MKLAIAFVLAMTAAAEARDSTWLICKGVATHADKSKTYLVVNLLEHRGRADRDLGVTLIYGDRVVRGAIVGTEKAPFLGKATPVQLDGKRKATFKGTLRLADDMTRVALDGNLDESWGDDAASKPTHVEAALTCEALDDQAIGH